jgi:hypothetical protein
VRRQHADNALTAPEAAVAGCRIESSTLDDAVVSALTAEIVPRMFRIMTNCVSGSGTALASLGEA